MKKDTQLSVFYIVFILVLIYIFLQSIINGYAKESWQITEWLINYQGGFVRRGLIGEAIFDLYNYFGLNPYVVILFLSIISYLAVVVFFAKSFLKKGYLIFLLPFVFFLGGPVINNFFIRKDPLIILIFILILFFSYKKSSLRIIAVNLLLIIGLLTYEPIAFISLPIVLLIFIYNNDNKTLNNRPNHFKAVIISLTQLLLPVFTFFACIYWKGSFAISKAIWESWKPVVFPFQGKDSSQIPAAIGALSWSLKRGLLYSILTFNNFNDGIYAPLAWLLILLLIYYLLSNSDKLNFKIFNYNPKNNFDKTNISSILIFQFLSISPLFILGWDYGRWVFLWVASSFAIIILIPGEALSFILPDFIHTTGLKINTILDAAFAKYQDIVLFIVLLLGVPVYGWSFYAYYTTNPLFIVLNYISTLIHMLLFYSSMFIHKLLFIKFI
jgi:hypothetical protein